MIENNLETQDMMAQNKRLFGIVISIAIILLVPLITMQFSDEINWKLGDFLVAGVLLLVTGLSCDFVLRKVKNRDNRIAICAVIIILLLLIWAELAVGVFGTPLAGS